MFQSFTGFQYLLIDAANNHHSGLDKQTFDERIDWATRNLDRLEEEAEGRIWKERPLYLKAVATIRKAQQGIPTGHLMGFDAICSGMQIMSALTGCHSGAKATGLIDTGERPDAYTRCTEIMVEKLGYATEDDRERVKQGVMTSLYGSRREPEKVFGEDTPELKAFYEAMFELCPGACGLLGELLNSWQPWTLAHEWRLPDGFLARVKVMQKHEDRIEVDELGHSTFTYVWSENRGERKGVKNAANVIHSVDSYLLRSLIRRCNYDREQAEYVQQCIDAELLSRNLGISRQDDEFLTEKVAYYRQQYLRSGIADIVILPHLDQATVTSLSNEHLRGLNRILETMLVHRPFEIITVHDDFLCHPNNMNHLRRHYREILAELAESELLSDILSQIHGRNGTYQKESPDLAQYIRQSNYCLS